MAQVQEAVKGQRARLTDVESVLSIYLSGLTPVNDGDIVVINTDGATCSAVTGATNTRYGVVVLHGIGKTGKNAAGEAVYQAGDIVPVMVIGSIWVKPTAPITSIISPVFVKTANGTTAAPLGSLGILAADSTALPGAAWESKTNSAGLAILRLTGA